MQFFGITLLGFTAENGRKLLISIGLIVAVMLANRLVRALLMRPSVSNRSKSVRFWIRQGWHLLTAVFLVAALLSLWFDDPTRLTTAIGLVTAGLAFALQKVVTAVAGYIVLMRGKIFSVGDRIVMGGVRGDVIELTFTQTYIMEMGQPPKINDQTDPAMWVQSRQYTGRIVSVSNARIFDEPVYNYTREFPYIWEEMHFGIAYNADYKRAEAILLDIARKHTQDIQDMSKPDRDELARRYFVDSPSIEPRVFLRMTDNWIELAVRFVCKEHGVRGLKDAMTRDILEQFDAANLQIASTTFEIVGLPPLKLTAVESTKRVDPKRVTQH